MMTFHSSTIFMKEHFIIQIQNELLFTSLLSSSSIEYVCLFPKQEMDTPVYLHLSMEKYKNFSIFKFKKQIINKIKVKPPKRKKTTKKYK